MNAFSVDVEDYFQVEAFRRIVQRESWQDRTARVEGSTECLLGLLDTAQVHATFFVLGWVAERFPGLVRRIEESGHELASHGYSHEMVGRQSRLEFREDIRRAKAILEDCAGVRVRGFRAPTFSIGRENWWAYGILAEEGYDYSSSLYPINHDLYGVPEAPRVPFRPLADGDMVEIPVTTIRLLGRNRPCGGGGFFRLRPYAVSRWYFRRVNEESLPCVFYCHPWEFDTGQPRIEGLSPKSRIRHYLNIGAMQSRVKRLLRDFAWGRIDESFSPLLGDSRKALPSWIP